MDQDLKHYLEGMESRIEAKFAKIEAKFDAKLDDLEGRLKIHIAQECEKVETKLLSAFHGWSRTMEIRGASAAGVR
jgi:hypothetical protein